MNVEVEDAMSLISLLQHDTLGSNTLSIARFTEDDIRVVILSWNTSCPSRKYLISFVVLSHIGL